MQKCLTLLTCSILWIPASTEASSVLSVEKYLSQVSQNNQGYAASEELQQSYATQALEGSLLFTPRFFTQFEMEWQQDPQFIPYFPIFLQSATLLNELYKVGIEQETPIGLDWQLNTASHLFQLSGSLPLAQSALSGTPLAIPSSIDDISWSTNQTLTIKQHLWKNGFGARTRARANQIKHNAIAQSYQEKFKLQQSNAKAQNVYWQLVIARALTEIRKETVEQAKKLVDYIEKKKADSLVLESEVYQALSILNSSMIDYQRAQETETATALAFNALRGISSSEVKEILVPLELELLQSMTPKTKGERYDLKAYKEMMESQKAQNTMAIQDLLPELSISGIVGLQGTSTKFGDSFERSITHPAFSAAVILKFSVPLSPTKISKIKRAHRESSHASSLNYERTRFEQNQEWDRLKIRLEENKNFLEFMLKNTAMQREKYENAKLEYSRGLSTIFVVTSAQNDYQLSKISALQTFQIIIDILINMSFYETN